MMETIATLQKDGMSLEDAQIEAFYANTRN